VPSELEGQVALVTGGGRGIGRAIALELASAEMRVGVSARTAEQVEETARATGGLAVVGDVSKRDDVERMVAETERELGPIPGMLERGRGRIVNVASGAAYLPGSSSTAYAASKAAVHRFSETLANQLQEHGIPVFSISPGLVRTAMTEGEFPDDAPWTPPELAPRLVRELASGRLDKLSGRYLHAEHDADLDGLARRADEIVANDLNAIRLIRQKSGSR
jgi:3-oxoacyl-[acyl-carrier protein] reductase